MICTRAKVISTGENVLLREPFHDEFTCSLCEPDYIQIDDNGNTIYDNAKNVIGYANDELILLDYHYDTTQPVEVKEYVDKDIIRNILNKTDVVETKCKSILTPDKSGWYDLKGCCIELIEILNEIRDVVK